MTHTSALWIWAMLTLSMAFASSDILVTVILTQVLTYLLDLLILALLAVGVVALWRLRRKQGKGRQQRGILPTNKSKMQPQADNRPRRVPSIEYPIALAVPIVMLFLVWFGGTMSAIPPASVPVHVTVTPSPTKTTSTLPTVPASDLAVPGVLTVGTSTSFPQQTYIDPQTHKAAGFDIDLITAIAQQMKLQVNLVMISTDLPTIQSSLNNKTADVVIAAYSLTGSVKASLQDVPYLSPHEVVLVQQNKPALTQFKQLTDLCGHMIGVLKSSAEDFTLQNVNCPPAKAINLKELPNADAVADELAKGQVDATYQDSPTSVYYFGRYEGKFMQLRETQGTDEGILIRKDDSAMLDAVQAAFNMLVQNNTYTNLLNKWRLLPDTLTSSGQAIFTSASRMPELVLYDLRRR